LTGLYLLSFVNSGLEKWVRSAKTLGGGLGAKAGRLFV
jgi:hypothetical protein